MLMIVIIITQDAVFTASGVGKQEIPEWIITEQRKCQHHDDQTSDGEILRAALHWLGFCEDGQADPLTANDR